MKLRSILSAATVLAALAAPGIAAAATAYAVGGTTNMRAGPGTRFPVVAQVLGGSRVNVVGCLSDYSWCDGTVQGIRGWMAASRLEFPYGSRRVLLPSYYSYFGAPVIRFDFGYWGGGERHRHRDRNWNRDRGHEGWNPDGDENSGWHGPGADTDVIPDEGDGGWRWRERRSSDAGRPRLPPRPVTRE